MDDPRSHPVRAVFLGGRSPWTPHLKQAARLLKFCPGLVDLVLDSSFSDPMLLKRLDKLRVQRLSAEMGDLFGGRGAIDFSRPCFASITHLTLSPSDTLRQYDSLICGSIQALPALTHLRLSPHTSWANVETFSSRCPRLVVLVMALLASSSTEVNPIAEWAASSPVQDVRFVITAHSDSNWRAAVRGRDRIWSLAEDFVIRRRSGAVDRMRRSHFSPLNVAYA
jgi:hypothetical protein